MSHTCHAIDCETSVPPRLHMCRPHWYMVSKSLRDALWAAYRPGQERDKSPSADYLRAAAGCVKAVAKKEGIKKKKWKKEVRIYERWARRVDVEHESVEHESVEPNSVDEWF